MDDRARKNLPGIFINVEQWNLKGVTMYLLLREHDTSYYYFKNCDKDCYCIPF